MRSAAGHAKDVTRQRAIAGRLVLSALREQDIAREAVDASNRLKFLADASRALSLSLDETATRDTVRRLVLPRPGTWCIVDVVETSGAIVRLEVVHADPEVQALARTLEPLWPSARIDTTGIAGPRRSDLSVVVTAEAGAGLVLAGHGTENLRILRRIGFGSMLVVPLIVRARVQGAITFISRAGDAPFTTDETSLAVDLASRCAMALDNARLYREAEALRTAAEDANKAKSRFLGAVSHELRTPLNAIGGYAELLSMGIHGAVTAEQSRAITRILANQQHLLKLISEILDFTRAESGRVEFHYRAVSLRAALVEVAELLEAVVADKQVSVVVTSGADAAVAWADPDRVRQILINLVMNAVKYSPRGGGPITLDCATEGDVACASVADTGSGIPPNKLESIFEPFVQLSAELSDRRGGVGLGLPISRDLAHSMGGKISVVSAVGVGSRFTLHLPVNAPDLTTPVASDG